MALDPRALHCTGAPQNGPSHLQEGAFDSQSFPHKRALEGSEEVLPQRVQHHCSAHVWVTDKTKLEASRV